MSELTSFSELKRTPDGRLHLPPKVSGNTIDPLQLIEEMASVKKINVEKYQDEIKLNSDERIPAIEELRTKAKTFQGVCEKLSNDMRGMYGSPLAKPNALSAKIASIYSNENDAVSIRADIKATATNNNHRLNVTQVASKDRVITGFVAPLMTTEIGVNGTLSINNTLITISETDTLAQIADHINVQLSSTNVTASVLQTSDLGNYQLVLESTQFATPINFQGTQGTSGSLFGLVPSQNTSAESLADQGNGPLTDVVTSAFTCSDHTAAMPFSGNLSINGQVFTLTGGTTTLDDLINDINSNTNANVTASLNTITNGTTTTYGLTLTATVAGTPLDFSATDYTLLGIIPQTPTANLAATATDTIRSPFEIADADQAMNYNGTLVINNQSVTLTESMTLNQLIAAINETSHIGVTASLQQDGTTNNYYMQLTATTQGVPIEMNGIQGTDSTLTGTNGLMVPSSNTSLDSLVAKFTFDGVNMTRNENIITNLLPGVTITLNTVSTQNTIFAIEYNQQGAFSALSDFVDAYNDLVRALHVHKQTNIDNKPLDDAILYGNTIILQMERILMHVLDGPILGNTATDSSYFSLANIGITSYKSNDPKDLGIDRLLKIDTEQLISSITKNHQSIIQLLGNFSSSSNPGFMVYDMSNQLSTTILGKPITVDYRYLGATSTDETFASNFSVPQPSATLSKIAAGQTVTLSYMQNSDGTFSASLYGIQNQQTVTVNNIVDGIITFPQGSIFDGLAINFIGQTPPDQNTPIVTTLTLPSYQATLSCPGIDDVVVNNVLDSLIEGPKGSVYEGLTIGYTINKTTPLVMNGSSVTTTLTLTRGIMIDLIRQLDNATQRHIEGQPITSLFDTHIEDLLSENKISQKNIKSEEEAAARYRESLEPLLKKLYDVNQTASMVSNVLERMNAKK